MKRLTVRLTVLSLVVVLGLFAIAQAQRYIGSSTDETAKDASPPPASPEGEPAPVPASDDVADVPPVSSGKKTDPFASSRLIDAVSKAPPAPADPPTMPKALAEANPLRGGVRTGGATVRPRDDGYVAAASYNESSSEEPPTRAPRKDPFDSTAQKSDGAERLATTGADAGRAAAGTNGSEPAPLKDRYGGGIGRYGKLPEPAEEENAASLPARRNDPADAELGEASGPSRYSSSRSAPAPLPTDDSPRAMPESREPARFDSGNGSMPAARDVTGMAGAIGGISPPDPATARPGSRQLDGPQSPQVTLQKVAPRAMQVGKPAVFEIIVRNTGTVSARDVVVRDVVPEGTTLVGTTPTAKSGGGQLLWTLGTLEPGEEKTLRVELLPQTEGEIGSVATVAFQANASARVVATRPELVLEAIGPKRVMIGQSVVISLTVSNPGSGVAGNVVLHQSLPPQVKHPAGTDLEFDIGELKPKEARQVELTLNAAAAGKVNCLISARGEGKLAAEAKVDFEIVAPALSVSLKGPRRRFLEREATYTVSVSNPGTAPAKDVELVSRLPQGMKFVSANNAGRYDQQTHAVYWSLAELPEGETGTVKLVAVPVEAGKQKLTIEGKADRNLSQHKVETIDVEGLAALVFEVADVADPVEVGGETAYEVHLVNQGTKAAANVRLVAILPAELTPLAAEGPTRGIVQDGRVTFEPLARLAPKTDTTYRVRVKALAAGDQRIRFQLLSDDMSGPVTKEESTRVYADR